MTVGQPAPAPLFADHSLALRLETGEAMANVSFVEARAKMSPGIGATWTSIAGAYAMFDGPDSPCTQTFCLGLRATPTDSEVQQIEEFFSQRGAPVFHEVCPLGPIEVPQVLARRGYLPIEQSNVLFQSLADWRPSTSAGPAPTLNVRIADRSEAATIARTAAAGWASEGLPPEMLFELMRVMALKEGASTWVVESDGQPIATAALAMHDRVAILAGASTLPEHRRLGAQRLLHEARLAYARQQGCDVVTVTTLPGSTSQRNAERHSFHVAYTRTKWQLIPRPMQT